MCTFLSAFVSLLKVFLYFIIFCIGSCFDFSPFLNCNIQTSQRLDCYRWSSTGQHYIIHWFISPLNWASTLIFSVRSLSRRDPGRFRWIKKRMKVRRGELKGIRCSGMDRKKYVLRFTRDLPGAHCYYREGIRTQWLPFLLSLYVVVTSRRPLPRTARPIREN